MAKRKEIVGIIVGGGPATGINGVISSATIEAVNHGKTVIGIRGGFKSLFEGNIRSAVPLGLEDVSRIHTEGGSIVRTSRDYPDRVKKKFNTLMSTIERMGIRYLVTIGGDGTLFMSNWIEREARGRMNIVHVPKTIDNDILLPGGVSTFGYETARHWGVEIVKNIMEDARTTGRWYFVPTMGRNAGHLALGIGKAAGATITLIPEEFREKKVSVKKVADILTGAIIKRLHLGKDHGVAILAEGISEKFDIEELRHYETLEKDETGRIRLAEIQLGRVLKNFVKKNLDDMGLSVTIVDKNIGYELRAADPIPYDIEYTRNLGYGAVKFLLNGGTAAMIVFDEGRLRPISFVEMIDPSTGCVKISLVDVCAEKYEVGRKYMIRFEKEDFEPKNAAALAKKARMSVKEFLCRFSYIVE